MASRPDARPVPWRVIFASIFAVLIVGVGLFTIVRLSRIVGLLVVASLFAVILGPAVNFLEHRARVRRSVATILVFITGIALFAAMIYAFVRPIVDQSQTFVQEFPEFVEDARQGEGRGQLGRLIERYNIDEWIVDNQDRFDEALDAAGRRAPDLLGRVASGLFATLTILVLSFLIVLKGPELQSGALKLVHPEDRRERLRRVAGDAARAITGYMAGNLMISLIAGIATYLALLVAGVPFREVLALWVAFADLIPLVGATLGAVPTILVALLHSTGAGVGIAIFFIAYQQFENHVLQVTVMSRTVDLNPLTVLVSVLIGVELFGILGALLAIPLAGVIQVVVRDVYDERQGRFKLEPTIGSDEIPISHPATPQPQDVAPDPAPEMPEPEVPGPDEPTAEGVPR